MAVNVIQAYPAVTTLPDHNYYREYEPTFQMEDPNMHSWVEQECPDDIYGGQQAIYATVPGGIEAATDLPLYDDFNYVPWIN